MHRVDCSSDTVERFATLGDTRGYNGAALNRFLSTADLSSTCGLRRRLLSKQQFVDGGMVESDCDGGLANDAHYDMGSFRAVPLLLIELILRIRVPAEQAKRLSWTLSTGFRIVCCSRLPR